MNTTAENTKFAFSTVCTDTDERFYFIAAAMTCGFELAENTPGISNTYSVDQKFDPGEPGDVRMLLDIQKGRLDIHELGEIWVNGKPALDDAENFAGLILTADDGAKLQHLVNSFDLCYIHAAVAHMRLFTLRRIVIHDQHNTSDEERGAMEALDTFVREYLGEMNTRRDREKAVRFLCKNWKPAMSGWVKAFVANYLEIRNLWKTAPEAIKIKRDNLPPLVIPKGPKFRELLERWT